MGGIVGGVAVPDRDRLDLGAEAPEVLLAQRREALERLLAVRKGRCWHDRNTRTSTARGPQQPQVEFGHRGEKFARPDERHRS